MRSGARTGCASALLAAQRAWVLREGVTYDQAAVPPLELPTLDASAASAARHPEWHAYCRLLYGEAYHELLPLDLNSFTWFYWSAPLLGNRTAPPSELRLLLAESGCFLLAADACSTGAEGGDVCSVRTGLYRAVS